MYAIQVNNVSKEYNQKKVLDKISLQVKEGELLVVIGPSGSGKTTLLRCIADLVEYTGNIEKMGQVSYVFQDEKLFPHLSAYENIAMGTLFQKAKKEDIETLADLLKIKECLYRKPKELSGGQAQRVSIARALLAQREILLMDEPFSSLDSILKDELLDEIKNIHKKMNNTLIYVTHNKEEALRLADHIVVLKDGLLQQIGTPKELWEKPVNAFVAQFVGNMNLIDDFAIRNEDIRVCLEGEEIQVLSVEYMGSYKRIKGFFGNQKINIDVSLDTVVEETVRVFFPEEKKIKFEESL